MPRASTPLARTAARCSSRARLRQASSLRPSISPIAKAAGARTRSSRSGAAACRARDRALVADAPRGQSRARRREAAASRRSRRGGLSHASRLRAAMRRSFSVRDCRARCCRRGFFAASLLGVSRPAKRAPTALELAGAERERHQAGTAARSCVVGSIRMSFGRDLARVGSIKGETGLCIGETRRAFS